ncbi:MAG: ribose-phosphate pyrophosphokinase [Bacteroidia bacterium]|nr:ribose-phosphate pyrophosphokinase [Bacteroidia bacterium]
MPTSPVKFFAGTNTRYLAEKIVKAYGTELGKSTLIKFSDGEFQPCFEETVRGTTVFIIQSTYPPADNLLELMFMIDAARRASAYKVVAVIPYFGFARQDRKDKPRVPIAAKAIADMLGAVGVDRVMTMDLHADQIQGFFNFPVDHVYASALFAKYIMELKLDNLVVAAPDMGGSKRANAYSRFLKTEMAICYKTRRKENVVEKITIIGDIKDKNVVILDDMIDTAGTITLAADQMMRYGAKSIRVIATHPVLSGPAYDRIENSAIEEVVVTDSIPLKYGSRKIKVISCAELFADVIHKVYTFQSISSSFIF